jgi:hypothetical protein
MLWREEREAKVVSVIAHALSAKTCNSHVTEKAHRKPYHLHSRRNFTFLPFHSYFVPSAQNYRAHCCGPSLTELEFVDKFNKLPHWGTFFFKHFSVLPFHQCTALNKPIWGHSTKVLSHPSSTTSPPMLLAHPRPVQWAHLRTQYQWSQFLPLRQIISLLVP